jgi:hypothetical protein
METSLTVAPPGFGRVPGALHWTVDQVFNRGLPALLLLGLAAWSARSRGEAAAPAPALPDERQRAARALLLCWGLVPLVLIPVMSVAFGSDLQLQWGTPFLLFLAPCVMELKPLAAWQRAPSLLVWKGFLAVQLLLVALTVATSPIGLKPLMDTHWRTFAAKRFADRLAEPVHRLLGGPVHVIVGSGAEAGALALQLPERPVVLIDGRYERSPWVRRETVAACGGLELLRSADPLPDATPVGPPFQGLHWRVILPARGAAPCPSVPVAADLPAKLWHWFKF